MNSQKHAHKTILKYVGIFTALTIIFFWVGGQFLNNYMKDVGNNPINAVTHLSAQEMAQAQKKEGTEPGEIGYEFKFDRPMVIVHNYLPGADRGYGTELPLVNDIPRKLVEPNLKNFETSVKKNFKDASPVAEDLDTNRTFMVVNRVDVDGGPASFHLYVLRDQAGQEYLVSTHLVPWNR